MEGLVRVVHSAKAFKQAFSVMKDLLSDVNMRFEPEGIRVLGVDAEKVSITHVLMRHLESYECSTPCSVGIYPPSLYKLVRNAGADDKIELIVTKPNQLLVKIIRRNTTTVAAVEGVALPVEDVKFPSVEYEATLAMPAGDLQRALRQVTHVSKLVAIGYEDRAFIVSASGPIGKVDHALAEPGWTKSPVGSSLESYFAKFIEKFVKPEVTESVDIYFKKGFPLTLQYYDKTGTTLFQFRIAPTQSE